MEIKKLEIGLNWKRASELPVLCRPHLEIDKLKDEQVDDADMFLTFCLDIRLYVYGTNGKIFSLSHPDTNDNNLMPEDSNRCFEVNYNTYEKSHDVFWFTSYGLDYDNKNFFTLDELLKFVSENVQELYFDNPVTRRKEITGAVHTDELSKYEKISIKMDDNSLGSGEYIGCRGFEELLAGKETVSELNGMSVFAELPCVLTFVAAQKFLNKLIDFSKNKVR